MSRIRACLPSCGRCGNCADLVDQTAAERERRNEQLPKALRAPEARDVVEEVGDIGRDGVVGGEDSDVLVDARRRGVVVAGADVRIPAQGVALAADDERHLRVDLHVGKPVHDVDARLFERLRPLDVAQLVEPRFQLDKADRLLSVLGALDERADQDAVVARAVDGRLHRDHLRIPHRCLGEHVEASTERAVRLVHEDVRPSNLVEDPRRLGLGGGEARRNRRYPGLVLQVRAVEGHQLLELGEVERALDAVDLRLVGAQADHQPRDHLRGRGRADLDADDIAEAASPELRLHGFEQVVGVVRDLEVGVARDAEDRTLLDRHSWKEGRQEVRDDLLERNQQAASGEVEEARQPFRDLDPREALLARVGIGREDGEREREPGDVRERLARADGERREHGVDLAGERLLELVELLAA